MNSISNSIRCYCTLFIVILFFSPVIYAQNSASSTDRSTDQGNYIIDQELSNLSQSDNSASINQVGVNNRAEVSQRREVSQLGLNAVIDQRGQNNRVTVNQLGGEQNIITQQNGRNNNISSEINGRQQQVLLRQNGQSNKIYQELNGSNEGLFILTQQGANHEIYHTRQGNSPTLEVRQTGFGAKVRIEQQ